MLGRVVDVPKHRLRAPACMGGDISRVYARQLHEACPAPPKGMERQGAMSKACVGHGLPKCPRYEGERHWRPILKC